MNDTPESERARRLDEAAETICALAGPSPRPLAMITGSGLAGLASLLEAPQRIASTAVPHLVPPAVEGHPGAILSGQVARLRTLCFTGRTHFYEGHCPGEVVFPIHLARRLGARIVLITNASGGVNPLWRPGDLMLLADHLDLTFRNSLIGLRDGGNSGCRAPVRSPYDPHLREGMREAARSEKIDLKEGVYAGTFGPSYETRAEAAMLRAMGADAVGMSTVPEVIAARQVGLRVVAVSCIANRVPAWGRMSRVTHEEVVARTRDAGERLKRLVRRWIDLVGDDASR